MTRTRILRPADVGLIVLIAAAALAMLLARPTRSGAAAEVLRDGQRVAVIDLRGARREIALDGDVPVVIVAEWGAIWFASSACPDQVCVRSGKLSRAGETAACLPAGVVIRVTGERVDAVTG